jgi:ubiquinone/menaquinone biosynthesis C-methylase UbiE
MERPFGYEARFSKVLEVGAGDGLHVPFVKHAFERYLLTDVSFEALAKAQVLWRSDVRIGFALADAQKLPFPDSSVDRLIATCVLLHLRDPESALREWRRVTRPGGVVTCYVPNEPTLLTRLGRGVTSRRAANRAGFQGFDLMMAREHINHGWGMDQLVRHIFAEDLLKVDGWPLARAPFSARVFNVYQIRVSDTRHCHDSAW